MVAFTLRSFASPLTVFLRITVLPRAIVLSSNSSGIGITCPKALKLLPNSHRASMQQVTQQVTQRKKIQPKSPSQPLSRMSRSAHYKRLAVSGLAFNDLLYLAQSHPKHVRYAAPQWWMLLLNQLRLSRFANMLCSDSSSYLRAF